MKVKIEYTVDVPDDYRRAINVYHGLTGLASRADVKWWLEQHGRSMDDDLMRQFEIEGESQ